MAEERKKLVLTANKICLWILILLGNLICIFSILGYLGQYHWTLDILSHFRVQYIVALLLLSLVAFLQKIPKQSLVWLVFVAVNALDLLTLPNFDLANAVPMGQRERIRVMQVNIHAHEENFPILMNSLKESDPDIISFQEFTDKSLKFMQNNLPDYPYRIYKEQEDCFGIALFSRLPLSGSIAYAQDEAGAQMPLPMIKADFEWQGKKIYIIAVHLLPPLRDWETRVNEVMVDDLSKSTKSCSNCFIVGDLNATKSGALFKKLLKEGNLKNSEDGFFWQPSFPVFFPPLWIAIDHCLTAPGLKVVNRQLGPATGSDHYPVIFDLQ